MAKIIKMTGDPVPNKLTLIAGSAYPFKVNGFGSDKKHLILKCSCSAVKVVVKSADAHRIEQQLRLEIPATITAKTQATLTAFLASNSAQRDLGTPIIAVTIEPKVQLPTAETEAGIVARMLLVENITPGQRQYTSAEESLSTMQWMRFVFVNRLKYGPQHFSASSAVTSIAELIKAPNQVAGFEKYPKLAPTLESLLSDILRIANSSTHCDALLYRQYIQNAIDVANLTKLGSDPSAGGLYAWRTSGSASPGDNFVFYKKAGGQDFYTLKK